MNRQEAIDALADAELGQVEFITDGDTGIRYVKAARGYEVYAIPSRPVFTDRRSALQALYEYLHHGTRFPPRIRAAHRKSRGDTRMIAPMPATTAMELSRTLAEQSALAMTEEA